jgi:hypothetical protein
LKKGRGREEGREGEREKGGGERRESGGWDKANAHRTIRGSLSIMFIAVRKYRICWANISSALALLLAKQQANSVIQMGRLYRLQIESMYLQHYQIKHSAC